MPIIGANRLVAKVSRLYAEAAPDDQFAAPSLDAEHHSRAKGEKR